MIEERAIGAVLGLALGDALGAPFEFRRRSEIPEPLPAFEREWMGLAPGTWTDDTALARNLWCSLIAHGGELRLADVLMRHQEWLAGRPPDVGNQTAAALREHARGTPEAARVVFERRGPEVSAGNGSVMYCAPLGVARVMDPGRLTAEAPALSAITHWDGRCRTACLAVTLATADMVRGEGPEGAVRSALASVAHLEGGEELEFLAAEAGRSRPVDGPDMGFALFCAGLALRVAVEAPSFEEGLRTVVGLGGDTDTNAAVAGALLGAREGAGALPAQWLGLLADRASLEQEANELARIAVTMTARTDTQTQHDLWSDHE